MKGVLHVSGDALRVVDETKKGLIVDQTIEKVSFCAPDRYHEKGFAYICRDGTTRRWLCHGFLTLKETGERLSYTVGCAFQVCLERKQKRDQDCQVTAQYTQDGTSFTRFGSFRPVSLNQRIIDPQSALIAVPVPLTPSTQKSQLIERPRPKGNYTENLNRSLSMSSDDLKVKLINELKRHSSLRPYDLSSTRQLLSNKTIPEEDNEFHATITGLSTVSLFDSSLHYQSNEAFHSLSTISFPSPPVTNENLTSSFYSLNSPSIHSNQTSPSSINEMLNPFSSQPRRSTNPFDDETF